MTIRQQICFGQLNWNNLKQGVDPTAVSFDGVAEEALEPAIQRQWLDRIAWPSFVYYPRLGKVRRYVDEHLHEKLTGRDVARIACCEYKYFSSYFHAKVNVRFTDWLRLVRVAEAARLLRAEDITVYHAARQAGFSNVRSLERAFRRFCGRTPAEYKVYFRPKA